MHRPEREAPFSAVSSQLLTRLSARQLERCEDRHREEDPHAEDDEGVELAFGLDLTLDGLERQRAAG